MDASTMFGVMLVAFLAIVVLCVKPLGSYIADVMQGRHNFALRAGGRVEDLLYRLCGVDSAEEMSWTQYAIALLLFNVLGAVVVYGLQRLQIFFPLNRKSSRRSARTRHSTRPSVSLPTPTGRGTPASRPWATLCRWQDSQCRTSCPRRRASRSPSS